MTWSECRDEFAKHPREACCIVAAHIAKCVWKPDEEWSLAAAWAIGAAQDFARGEENAASAADATTAASASATSATAAAYAAADATAAAYAAARSSWYQFAVSRLPPPGAWGQWRQVRGLAVAGDYFIRINDEDGWLFVERAQLTQDELVCLDEILERAA